MILEIIDRAIKATHCTIQWVWHCDWCLSARSPANVDIAIYWLDLQQFINSSGAFYLQADVVAGVSNNIPWRVGLTRGWFS